jgi:hypothetical protein
MLPVESVESVSTTTGGAKRQLTNEKRKVEAELREKSETKVPMLHHNKACNIKAPPAKANPIHESVSCDSAGNNHRKST